MPKTRTPKAPTQAKAETKPDPTGRLPAPPTEPWANLSAELRDEFLRGWGTYDPARKAQAFYNDFMPTVNIHLLRGRIMELTGVADHGRCAPKDACALAARYARKFRQRHNLSVPVPDRPDDPRERLDELATGWCDNVEAELNAKSGAAAPDTDAPVGETSMKHTWADDAPDDKNTAGGRATGRGQHTTTNDLHRQAQTLRELAGLLRTWGEITPHDSQEARQAARKALCMALDNAHLLWTCRQAYGLSPAVRRHGGGPFRVLDSAAALRANGQDLGGGWCWWDIMTQSSTFGTTASFPGELDRWAGELEKAIAASKLASALPGAGLSGKRQEGDALAGGGAEPYDPDAYMTVKEAREGMEPPRDCAQWTKIKKANPWLRFDPKGKKNRPRVHRADAARLQRGKLDRKTFELLDVPGLDLPSVADSEITADYLADAAATKAKIRAEDRRRSARE